jgi:hypothetical protein
MVVNDDAGNLTPRGVLRFIASRLAPTGFHAGIKQVFMQAIKSPTTSSGGMARQAGKRCD